MIKTISLQTDNDNDKDFKFTLFGKCQNLNKDKRVLEIGAPAKSYNLIISDGTLKTGYGIEDLSMPESEDNLDYESKINVRGSEVKTIWKLKWYDVNKEANNYYLFYFNDENDICFDNMFEPRIATFIIENTFTDTPYATYYRKNGQDAILLSGEGSNLMVITGQQSLTSETAPKIINCCSHYGKLFAITAKERGVLVYNDDLDVLAWSDEKTKDLDFSDDRGDLNKIVSLGNSLFVFRDFGITKITQNDNTGEFDISHIYQSCSYIVPSSIAQAEGKIYFLEGECLKEFNGSKVGQLNFECQKYLKGISQRYAYGACIDGKYFLACRGDFKDEHVVGCEGYSGGYKNNMLFVYDISKNTVDILRGVDINEMLAFTNVHKSKLILCFNNENIGRLGQLSFDGQVFGEKVDSYWESGTTDFSMPGKVKRIKSFSIQSEGDCKVTISSDQEKKSFAVKGKTEVQKLNANILGKQFDVKIEVSGSEKVNISELTLTVSARQ